jgi:uncharacterized membrane protein YdjX (TVP38/TMEM64 family)
MAKWAVRLWKIATWLYLLNWVFMLVISRIGWLKGDELIGTFSFFIISVPTFLVCAVCDFLAADNPPFTIGTLLGSIVSLVYVINAFLQLTLNEILSLNITIYIMIICFVIYLVSGLLYLYKDYYDPKR